MGGPAASRTDIVVTTYDRLRPQSRTVARVERLLGRYPHLCERELTDLVRAFPSLNMLDQALIATDARLSKNLANFYRDQGSVLGASRRFVGLLAFSATVAILTLFALML